ncbi:PKD domain-containing protein, partial [Methanophagales archaeon]
KVGPENWYAKDSYVKLISGTLAGQDINSSNPEITVSPDKQISGSFDISVKNTGHSGSIFPIVATPNWGSHESCYWSITGHQAPGIKTHTVNVVLTAPSKPGVYYIIVAGQWELSTANVASGTNWRVGENHWNDGNDLADWSTTKIEEAINSGLVIADWEKVEGMIKMYVPATAIRVKVVTEKPKAWLHSGYDLFNTRYYPYPSETAVPMNNFNLSWTSPNKGKILTGDINDDGNLELVSASEERVCALDKDGNELWSRNVATDSGISGAKVNSMDLADMDGDNVPEVILGVSPAVPYPGVNKPLRILFYDGSGNLLKIISTPDSHRINVKCADLDGDGTKEVIATINAWYTLKPRGVYVYDYTTGNELWHYNVGPQIWIDAIADINNDGYKEIILGSFAPHNGNSDHGTDDSHSYVFCFDKDGNNLWTKQIGWDSVSSSVADLDGDGKVEIISFRNQNEPYYPGPNDVYILNPANGNIVDTYNGPSNKGWKGWAIAEINGDDKKEIVVGNRDSKLRVLDHNLNLINSNSISGTVQAINDINGDGKEEIIVCTDNKRILVLDTDLSRKLDYELGANGNAIVSDLIPGGTNEIIASADKLYVLSGVVIPPTTIDQIMSDAKLIEKIQTNSTVNLSAIIDDSEFDAILQGDYAVWEEKLDDYIYKGTTYSGVVGYSKSPVIIKIAVNEDGDFYLGTFNGTANDNLLIFSQNYRGITNYRDFSGNLLDKSVYGEPHDIYLDLDARQNYLAYIFGEIYKSLYNKGYIKTGPKDYYELYNCNYSLENYFERQITVIRSFICHQQFDYSWYDEKYRPIDEARNAKWSPIANNPDQNRDLSRTFNVSYQNVNESFVWIRTYTDNGMHSDITIYGIDNPPDYSCSGGSGGRTWRVTYDPNAGTYKVHNDNCAAAELFLDNQLPDRVYIGGYTTWSRLEQSVTIAVLGDIITSNHTESPSPGDDNNPEPLKWVIPPSGQANQPPIASFTYSPLNPVVNQTITFNASSSYDPDGTIVKYEWDFGDGNITSTTEETINHSYSEAGSYEVTLTVTDNDGATNSTTKIMTVSPPTAIFDTGTPSNPYPSISGTHTGDIIPSQDITVHKIYTYPCEGTGGHTEYARIWNKTWNATATWEGYASDWHNITFDKPVVLLPN